MKRISVKSRGLEFVSNLFTKKALKKLLPLAKKAVVETNEENIAKLHQVYDTLEEIPEDRHKLIEWLNSGSTKEFAETDSEGLNVILSEILNAHEQTEGCGPAKILLEMKDFENETLEIRIFTKTQPLSIISENELFDHFTFEDSEMIVTNEISNSLVLSKVFSDSLISMLLENDIITKNIVFANEENGQNFISNILVSLLETFEGQVLNALSNDGQTVDFDKPVTSYSDLLAIIKRNEVRNLSKTVKEKILKMLIENLEINPLDSRNVNYLDKRKIEGLVRRSFSITWTFTSRDIEITATLSNGRLTFDKEMCPHCGRIVTTELLTLPNGTRCCVDCLRDTIDDNRVYYYHSDTISNMQSSCGDSPSEKARYGIELEMIRNTNLTYQDWETSWCQTIGPIIFSEGNLGKLEHDGSLGSSGEEMITQALNKEFILGPKMKTWIDACKELYHPSSSCGLHVHVDRSALTPKQWGGVLRFVANNYNAFVSAGIFRRTNGYNDLSCIKRLVDSYNEDEVLFENFIQSSSHYSTISYSRHTGRTIEFRMFDSTVEYDKFIKNLKTIMVILDNAETLSGQNNISIQI